VRAGERDHCQTVERRVYPARRRKIKFAVK
jgi:hypothetical protein